MPLLALVSTGYQRSREAVRNHVVKYLFSLIFHVVAEERIRRNHPFLKIDV